MLWIWRDWKQRKLSQDNQPLEGVVPVGRVERLGATRMLWIRACWGGTPSRSLGGGCASLERQFNQGRGARAPVDEEILVVVVEGEAVPAPVPGDVDAKAVDTEALMPGGVLVVAVEAGGGGARRRR